MKNNENTYVLVLTTLIVAMTTFGCKGTQRSPIRENLFAKRTAPVSRQSAEMAASEGSGPAKIDFDAAKAETSNVALASYVSQNKKANTAQWLDSYEEAVELSKQSGKPILADFTGSNWCGFCVKLKKEIFDTPQFKSWAAENVVLLELDYPRPNLQADWIKRQNNMLRDRYQINGYPTVLILNPDGSVIGSQKYQRGGPKPWIAVVDNILKSNRALQNAKLVDVTNLKNLQ